MKSLRIADPCQDQCNGCMAISMKPISLLIGWPNAFKVHLASIKFRLCNVVHFYLVGRPSSLIEFHQEEGQYYILKGTHSPGCRPPGKYH